MSKFRYPSNSMRPLQIVLISASPKNTSKAKICITVALLLATLVVLSVASYFLFVPRQVPCNATDWPVGNWTTPIVTDPPIEWTTEPEPEKEPSDLDTLYKEMDLNMDEKVNPCDDFYEFACGLFSERHPVAEYKSEVNYFSIEYDKIRNKSIEILDGESLKEKSPSLKYLKRIWDSCVHETSDTRLHLYKLLNYFEELDQLETWEEKFARVTRDGLNVFFTVKVERHPRWSYQFSFAVDRPELEFGDLIASGSRSQINSLLEFYSQLIRLSKNDTREISNHMNLAKEIVDFERQMFTNMTSMSDRVNRPWEYNKDFKQHQLSDLANFNWDPIILTVAKIRKTWDIIVHDIEYLKKFKSIVDSKTESFLSDYIKMSIVRQSCFALGHECRALHRKLIEKIDPSKVVDYERQTCFDKMSEHLEELIFRAYILDWKREDENETKQMALQLVGQLEEEVRNFGWMDGKTREEALEKVNLLNRGIEFKSPYWLTRDSWLEGRYNLLPFFESTGRVDFFEFFRNLSMYKKEQEMEQLDSDRSATPAKFYSWPISLFSTRPKLMPLRHDLLVPALVLQGHFYNETFPSEIKFGLLGSLMGHALAHAVDGVSAKTHESVSKFFWTKGTRDAFDEQMKCLVNAYENEKTVISGRYSVKIDGNATQDENLADWMGLAMAFEAYRNVSREMEPLPAKTNYPTPLEKFTEDQMFFMSYANVHCTSETEESLMDVILDSTSPRKYRVNVPLKQMDQFAEAFNCDRGSVMNPTKKCLYH